MGCASVFFCTLEAVLVLNTKLRGFSVTTLMELDIFEPEVFFRPEVVTERILILEHRIIKHVSPQPILLESGGCEVVRFPKTSVIQDETKTVYYHLGYQRSCAKELTR